MVQSKTAILFSGYLSGLSQEVAIVDQLIEKNGLVLSPSQTYLAGGGSGALNVLAINACFKSKNPLPWNGYYKNTFLSTLSNDDVFLKTHPAYWDTITLHKTISKFLENGRLERLSDFTFSSHILAWSYEKGKTIWAGSESVKNSNVRLIDLIMASTAMPVIFPTQYIEGVNDHPTGMPDGRFCDGAYGGIFKRFKKNLNKEVMKGGRFDKIFVISPSRETDMIIMEGYNFSKCLPEERHKIEAYLENCSMQGFLKFLKKLRKANQTGKLANTVYVSMPRLQESPNPIDFNQQTELYNQVTDWARQNPNDVTIELGQFLKLYGY